MYEFNSRVRYSEIDHHGTLTLPALINYFQDCSTFQSEDVGLGTEVLKAEKPVLLAGDRRTVSRIGRKDHDRNISDRI
mgnify:CR=1 FL=1